MDNYSDYDGLGLAQLVATKQVTPGELVEAAIARVERHNPALNAVVYTGFDDARARLHRLQSGEQVAAEAASSSPPPAAE